ncbi:MAG: hypothetical protein LBT26_11105, partial [Clostridiales Family XIII bacterium]|nr:hypothetical protein [Clostridiales Family XIII bacterium]
MLGRLRLNEFRTRADTVTVVGWISNVHVNDNSETNPYVLNIYKYADYQAGNKDNPVYTETVKNATNHTVPAGRLTDIARTSAPSYKIEVTAKHPGALSSSAPLLSAAADIRVLAKPNSVQFAKPASLYITDAQTAFSFSWLSDTFEDTAGAEFKVTVINNATQETVYSNTDKAFGRSGSGTVPVTPVAGGTLKDIYIASVESRNAADDPYSRDSFVLWVYDHDALKIAVNRHNVENGSEQTLENISKVRGLDSASILALNRDIQLYDIMGINKDDYKWGTIDDGIQWNNSNDGAATVNYRQASLFDDISLYDMTQFRPDTEFMVAGIDDGETTITATHARTGQETSVDLTVRTLKDKLYIFSAFPSVSAPVKITYTDGNGTAKTVTSATDGRFAVYEENGIQSDVGFAVDAGAHKYRGTLRNDELLTGETNATRMQLYPLNAVRMRDLSAVGFYIKKPDGTPYAGAGTYNAGVYKNGEYCADAELLNQTFTTGADGRVTVNMDASLYYVKGKESPAQELYASDKLEFVFEMQFAGDAYRPTLASLATGATEMERIHFGTSIITLQEPGDDRYQPFIVSTREQIGGLDYDVLYYKGKTGPSTAVPSVTVTTRTLLWGRDPVSDGATDAGYDTVLSDRNGAALNGQIRKIRTYPFSTMSFVENVWTFDDNAGIAQGDLQKPVITIYDADGSPFRSLSPAYDVANNIGAPDPRDIEELYEEIPVEGSGAFPAGGPEGDTLLKDGIGFLGSRGFNIFGKFSYKLIPTPDPDMFIYIGVLDISKGMNTIDKKAELDTTYTGVDAWTTEALWAGDAIIDTLKGNMIKELDAASSLEAAARETSSLQSDLDWGVQIGGYIAGYTTLKRGQAMDSHWDTWNSAKYELSTTSFGVTAGGAIGYHWYYNTMVGPVPVTAEIALGAAVQYSLKHANAFTIQAAGLGSDVADLNVLKLAAFAKGFAGVGFDFSIVAVKIGLFGEITIQNYDYFLDFPEYGDAYHREAQYTEINGGVGIEFVIKLILINYRKTLASASWGKGFVTGGDDNFKEIMDWIDRSGVDNYGVSVKPKETKNFLGGAFGGSSLSAYGTAAEPELEAVKSELTFEARGYLSQGGRAWQQPSASMLLSIDALNKTADIQSNAYPYANPKLTRDGKIMAYMSDGDSADLNMTNAAYAVLSNGAYADRGAIKADAGQPHNNLQIAGTESFAAGAWETTAHIDKEAGSAVEIEDILRMVNSTEIEAGVYDGSAWTTTALTDNETADLSPAVAANNGKAVVAWRRAGGNYMEDLTDMDAEDGIVYKYYRDGVWGPEQTLYNGGNGQIRGISSEIDAAGNAIVAYVLAESDDTLADRDVYYSTIAPDGTVSGFVRLTRSDGLNENVQAVTTEIDGAETFLLAWHNLSDSVHDIRLQAVRGDGSLNADFPMSIDEISANAAVSVGGNFRLVPGAAGSLDNLAIAWKESVTPDVAFDDSFEAEDIYKNAAKDEILAVKFFTKDGFVHLTAPQSIAEMPDNTTADDFDAYVDGNTVNAVIAATEYLPNSPETVLLDDGSEVIIPGKTSSMKSATGEFTNRFSLVGLDYDVNEIRHDNDMPLQFTAVNSGIEPITKIEVSMNGGAIYTSDNLVPLYPNEKTAFNAAWRLPPEGTPIPLGNFAVT